ncbi:MAG: N-6 DNA methylase [Myxococcota bacterium]
MHIGGRAAVIVPDGVLFGSTGAHKAIRKLLVEKHLLEGVVSMPSGVFKPYSGVSTNASSPRAAGLPPSRFFAPR